MGTVGLSRTEKGQATDATGIQIAGVLDDLFAYDGPLGANVIKDGVKFDVWSPTAQVTFKKSSYSGSWSFQRIMKLLAVWIHLKL
jgi:hypothetical protein